VQWRSTERPLGFRRTDGMPIFLFVLGKRRRSVSSLVEAPRDSNRVNVETSRESGHPHEGGGQNRPFGCVAATQERWQSQIARSRRATQRKRRAHTTATHKLFETDSGDVMKTRRRWAMWWRWLQRASARPRPPRDFGDHGTAFALDLSLEQGVPVTRDTPAPATRPDPLPR
jgi:hypothetical protein